MNHGTARYLRTIIAALRGKAAHYRTLKRQWRSSGWSIASGTPTGLPALADCHRKVLSGSDLDGTLAESTRQRLAERRARRNR